jgi:L-fuculose-phosphate aldolase
VTEIPSSQLIKTAQAMNSGGLNQGTSGNLSVRSGSGMLITPSGMEYTDLEPEDIVSMDFEGIVSPGGGGVQRKPSSEWRLHADIYRQYPQANAVLHAHPVYCTALSCMSKDIPAFHYMVAIAGGRDIRCAHYATFGSRELSGHVLEALRDRKACLMAHHGLLCFEENLTRVLRLANEIEHLARVYSTVLSLGQPDLLTDTEMARVLDRFSTYGKQD